MFVDIKLTYRQFLLIQINIFPIFTFVIVDNLAVININSDFVKIVIHTD